MSVVMKGGTSGNRTNGLPPEVAQKSQPIQRTENSSTSANYQFTQNTGDDTIAETKFHEMPTGGKVPDSDKPATGNSDLAQPDIAGLKGRSGY